MIQNRSLCIELVKIAKFTLIFISGNKSKVFTFWYIFRLNPEPPPIPITVPIRVELNPDLVRHRDNLRREIRPAVLPKHRGRGIFPIPNHNKVPVTTLLVPMVVEVEVREGEADLGPALEAQDPNALHTHVIDTREPRTLDRVVRSVENPAATHHSIADIECRLPMPRL